MVEALKRLSAKPNQPVEGLIGSSVHRPFGAFNGFHVAQPIAAKSVSSVVQTTRLVRRAHAAIRPSANDGFAKLLKTATPMSREASRKSSGKCGRHIIGAIQALENARTCSRVFFSLGAYRPTSNSPTAASQVAKSSRRPMIDPNQCGSRCPLIRMDESIKTIRLAAGLVHVFDNFFDSVSGFRHGFQSAKSAGNLRAGSFARMRNDDRARFAGFLDDDRFAAFRPSKHFGRFAVQQGNWRFGNHTMNLTRHRKPSRRFRLCCVEVFNGPTL